jgi:hypothetical protein
MVGAMVGAIGISGGGGSPGGASKGTPGGGGENGHCAAVEAVTHPSGVWMSCAAKKRMRQ